MLAKQKVMGVYMEVRRIKISISRKAELAIPVWISQEKQS
jgi:hypothetical protein